MAELSEMQKEYDGILNQLSDPELISNWDKFEKITKRKIFIEKILSKEEELKEMRNRIEENKAIIEAKEDPELLSLAEGELAGLAEKEKTMEKELERLLKGSNKELESIETKNGDSSVIVEIREGTGGEEAALFASDLFKMYFKYSQSQGWKLIVLDSQETEIGGFKEITFELKNGDIFSKMKYEGGVHRIQRVPDTEKNNRIHTSTATVAVLPKPKSTQIKINPSDLRIDFYNASGPGGQNVNKRKTAVRITYVPTGLVVTSQSSRNQQDNREYAFSILEAKILRQKEEAEEEKFSGKRKAQIGLAKRSEKIRTYNFPQDRITDHRIKKSWHNIKQIMDGNLDKIIEALQNSNGQAEKSSNDEEN